MFDACPPARRAGKPEHAGPICDAADVGMPVQEDEGLLDEPDSPLVHSSPPWQPAGTLEPLTPWHAPTAPGGVIPERVLFRASQPLRRAWVCCGLCGCTLLAALLLSSRATDRTLTRQPASPPTFVTAPPAFVTARGGRLYRGKQMRRFMGANLWYAVHLGCRGCDRARLRRELDALRAAGVSSVRITALSEGPDDAPWRAKLTRRPGASASVRYVPRASLLRGVRIRGAGQLARCATHCTSVSPGCRC